MKFGNVRFGNVQFGDVKFGNVKIGNVKFGNVKFGNVQFGDVDSLLPVRNTAGHLTINNEKHTKCLTYAKSFRKFTHCSHCLNTNGSGFSK